MRPKTNPSRLQTKDKADYQHGDGKIDRTVADSFDVLNDAITFESGRRNRSGELYDLVDIANIALEQNQDLQAVQFGALAGEYEINRARSQLMPQLWPIR